MGRIALQKIWKECFLNRGERTKRFQVADSSAIALRVDASNSRNALIRDQHVAEFTTESVLALHHIAVEDDASSIARTNDVGNRSFAAIGAKDGIVSPERRCIGIVQIGNWFAQFVCQTLADIESRPFRMHKVGRTPGTELARSTGRAGSIKADGYDVI